MKYMYHIDNILNKQIPCFRASVQLLITDDVKMRCAKNKRVVHELIAECVTDVATTS